MTEYSAYDDMAYVWEQNRAHHEPGADYELSVAYRTTQLPLANPSHTDVVSSDAEGGYDWMGTYEAPRISVVAFIPYEIFFSNPMVSRIFHEISTTAAGRKIAWDILEARKYRHHATVAGMLNGRMGDDDVVPFVTEKLAGTPSCKVQMYGPWFFGPKNGRLYFPLCAELGADGVDGLTAVQDRLSNPRHPGFYVGCLQLTDHLSHNQRLAVHEADELFAVLARHHRTVVAEFEITELAVIRTHDDLILNSRVLHRVPLG